MKKKNCIIVDLEGTITDSSKREHLRPLENGKFNEAAWKPWNDLFRNDPPDVEMIDLLRKISNDNTVIIISSSKPVKYLADVVGYLIEHVDFSYELLMRDENDKTEISSEIKKRHVLQAKQKYKIILAVDDRKENLKMLKEQDIFSFTPASFISYCSGLYF